MEAVAEDLRDGVALIDECLKLLEDPQELYKRCTDEQRRTLNQALFVKLLIQEDTITGHHLNEPFAELHTVQRIQNLIATGIKDPDKIRQHAQAIHAENTGENEKATRTGGSLNFQKVEALLEGMNLVHVSSKASMVELRGLEPLTPCMPCRCATSCATAPNFACRELPSLPEQLVNTKPQRCEIGNRPMALEAMRCGRFPGRTSPITAFSWLRKHNEPPP